MQFMLNVVTWEINKKFILLHLLIYDWVRAVCEQVQEFIVSSGEIKRNAAPDLHVRNL